MGSKAIYSRLALIVLAFFAMNCSFLSNKNKYYYDDDYEFENVPAGWKLEKTNDVDYLYHFDTHIFFYSSSLCDYYSNQDVETISEKRLKAINVDKIVSQKKRVIAGVDSLQLLVKATMYEKPVEIMILNMFKNKCFYELVLINKDKLTTTNKDDFEQFIQGIKF